MMIRCGASGVTIISAVRKPRRHRIDQRLGVVGEYVSGRARGMAMGHHHIGDGLGRNYGAGPDFALTRRHPKRWTEAELESDAAVAKSTFRHDRLLEPLDLCNQFFTTFAEVTPSHNFCPSGYLKTEI
jgi:hypothetical protein